MQRRGLARTLAWTAFAAFSGSLATLVSLMVWSDGAPGPLGVLIGMMLVSAMVLAPTCALVAMIVGMARWHFARGRAWLLVERETLVIRGRGHETAYPLSAFRTGWLNPSRKQVELELQSGDVLRARLKDVHAGRRLLDAAGLCATHRSATMRLGATLPLDVLVFLTGPVALWPPISSVGHAAPWPWPLNAWLYLAAFMVLFHAARQLFGPAEVVIGSDGVIVRQNFQQSFLPYERVAHIEVTAAAVTFALTDGSMLHARARALSADQQEQLRTRLADAHASWSAGDVDAAATASLERRGRSVSSWRAALATRLEREDGYRDRSTTAEHLLAAVESGAAPPERRIGAALALAASGDAELRRRVRFAAEATANLRLRVALESVARGSPDDEAIEEALDIEEESAPVAAVTPALRDPR